MDEHFTRLEAKVNETIELIQRLRRENDELQTQVRDLEERLQTTVTERDRAQQLATDAGENASRVEQFEEKRRLIEEKVSGLLEKLEALG